VVISALLETVLFSDTVKIYDLSLSGQVYRSGFHGLAGEVVSASPLGGLKVVAYGRFTLSEEIRVTGNVRTTGIFVLQLPATPDCQWSVSLLAGDTVVAGPVVIEITKPGIGLDWNLSSKPSDSGEILSVERDAQLNRLVSREIVKAAPVLLSNVLATYKPKPWIPRLPQTKILEPGQPPALAPKRTARGIDQLEDEPLIGLAEKLQTKEWSDRFMQRVEKPLQNSSIVAYNWPTGNEAIHLQISWKEGQRDGSLFIRVEKLDEATLKADRTNKAGFLLRDHSRSVSPQHQERLVGYNGVYSTWGSNSGVLALWKGYHVTINLASENAALISTESLTGFLALTLEGL
jgi:hypothetical protein